LLSQICFKLKRFDRAIHWAGRALELTPENLGQRVLSAHARFSNGDLAGAEKDYHAVLDRDVSHLDSLMNLAAIAEARSDPELAESRYASVLKYHATHPIALKKYGLLLARKSPGTEALPVLEQAHLANPMDTECLLRLGFLYEKHQAAVQAIELYRRAVQLNPRLERLAAEKIRKLEALGAAPELSTRQPEPGARHSTLDR
jgi:tetratricopeptide (TPR) repeat protein